MSFATTNDERITELVQRYEESGLLREIERLNHGPNYTTDEMLLGRTADGDRIFGQLRIEHHDRGGYTTIDGEQVDSVWGFAFTHTRIAKGGRRGTWAESGGASIPGEVTEGSNLTAEEATELADLAERWHLNTHNAGTRQQRILSESIKAEELERGGHLARYRDRCFSEIPDDNGYRWGSNWLVEEMPADEAERVLELFAKASDRR